jgi:glycerol-3-phosphate dehydrogenase (NAD(P)+)
MKATVIGDGGWGTALAIVLNSNGHDVTVWGPFPEYISKIKETSENNTFLPGIPVPPRIEWTSDIIQAVADAELIILAVPTKYYKDSISPLAGLIPSSCHVVSVAKGLDRDSHKRMSEVAQDTLKINCVAALSGPSHAEEVAKGIPTAVAVAADKPEISIAVQEALSNKCFRVYTSEDVIGVELGGALKNIIAIAAGVSDGLGFGDNTKAALITRGLSEIIRLGCAVGAKPETFAGLSGIGDLIVTCASKLSRNRGVGERLGKGESANEILDNMEQAAEGVWNCASALSLAQSLNIDVPITEQVHAIIYEGKNPLEAVESLLSRDPKPENQ